MKKNNYFGRTCQKNTTRRRDHHVLKNVVSLRISDDELELLKQLRAATSKSMSEIMRDAFLVLHQSALPNFDKSSAAA